MITSSSDSPSGCECHALSFRYFVSYLDIVLKTIFVATKVLDSLTEVDATDATLLHSPAGDDSSPAICHR